MIQNFDIERLGTVGKFAGIGSRKINSKRAKFQMLIGLCMILAGYKLKSGAADGSDTNFEFGAKLALKLLEENIENFKPNLATVMDAYLPWPGFNGRPKEPGYIVKDSAEARLLTSKYHQNWPRLSEPAKSLMSRNAMQILDENLMNPVNFVICETDDGAYTSKMTSANTGGTGQAIRIADDYNVPVFNIKEPKHKERLQNWLEKFITEFKEKYKIDLKEFFENEYKKFDGINNNIEKNIIEATKEGDFDVLIHGCNCFNTKGSGLAKSIFDEFPEAFEADQKTLKGNKKKLGTYTFAEVERNNKKVVIVNAYTQFKWGRDPNELYVDYQAVRNVFTQINKDFKGKNIAIPKIGAGLANGCWVTISNIINDKAKNLNVTLFKEPESLELKDKLDYESDDYFIIPMTHDDNFVFFWGKETTFSQWHPSKFKENELTFVHCEQYMMYKKAMLFNDKEIAKKIMNEEDPSECKKLGRKVSGFNQKIWDENCDQIVFEASKLKYTQNPEMLIPLILSNKRTIVEASPYDDIWGIGLRETSRDAKNPEKWKGQNKLGKALEKTRQWILENKLALTPEIQKVINECLKRINENTYENDQMSLFN